MSINKMNTLWYSQTVEYYLEIGIAHITDACNNIGGACRHVKQNVRYKRVFAIWLHVSEVQEEQNQTMMIEIRKMDASLCWGELGVNMSGTYLDKGNSGLMKMFCILIWAVYIRIMQLNYWAIYLKFYISLYVNYTSIFKKQK